MDEREVSKTAGLTSDLSATAMVVCFNAERSPETQRQS